MITEAIEDALKKSGVHLEEFSELLIRLLDSGVICRDENQTEERLYDRFLQIKSVLEDYLSPLHLRINHNTQFHYVRVFPPGAVVPGMQDEYDRPFKTGLRERLNQLEIATLLVLRAEYDKALKEGNLDENGCVMLPIEGLTIAMRNLLQRSLPANKTERNALFAHLKQLRVIFIKLDDEEIFADAWLKIRPMIMDLVNDQLLNELSEQLQIQEEAANEQESQTEKNTAIESSVFNDEEPAETAHEEIS